MWFIAKVVSKDVVQFIKGFHNKEVAVLELSELVKDNKKWLGLIEYIGNCPNGLVDIVFKFGPLLRVEIAAVYPSGQVPDINDNYEVYEGVIVE